MIEMREIVEGYTDFQTLCDEAATIFPEIEIMDKFDFIRDRHPEMEELEIDEIIMAPTSEFTDYLLEQAPKCDERKENILDFVIDAIESAGGYITLRKRGEPARNIEARCLKERGALDEISYSFGHYVFGQKHWRYWHSETDNSQNDSGIAPTVKRYAGAQIDMKDEYAKAVRQKVSEARKAQAGKSLLAGLMML